MQNQLNTQDILVEIKSLSRPEQIQFYTHFFRADPGDICFGEKLLAIKVPELRKLIKKYFKGLTLPQTKEFLDSEYNEIRFFGQQVVLSKYKLTKDLEQKSILLEFLQDNIISINHWNLVDTIAQLFGDFCLQIQDFELIQKYSNAESIWVRRIGIVACLDLIRTKNKDYLPVVLRIIDNNKTHKHEYIQKAIGWILREVGKLDEKTLVDYLQKNWKVLNSTTRSYATEKLRQTIDTKLLFGKN